MVNNLSPWIIVPGESIFTGLRAWATQYHCDKTVYANNVIYGKHVFICLKLWAMF